MTPRLTALAALMATTAIIMACTVSLTPQRNCFGWDQWRCNQWENWDTFYWWDDVIDTWRPDEPSGDPLLWEVAAECTGEGDWWFFAAAGEGRPSNVHIDAYVLTDAGAPWHEDHDLDQLWSDGWTSEWSVELAFDPNGSIAGATTEMSCDLEPVLTFVMLVYGTGAWPTDCAAWGAEPAAIIDEMGLQDCLIWQ